MLPTLPIGAPAVPELPAGASAFESDMPTTVYQTSLVGGESQDGSTPLSMTINLAPATTAALVKAVKKDGHALSSLIHIAVRRLDLRELEEYDPATRTMMGMRLSQAMFDYDLRPQSHALVVNMHRKEMPVSANYGGAPFRLVVLFTPAGETVVSSPFVMASKECAPKPPKPAPKRIRAPCVRLPVRAPAVGPEATITHACKTLKRKLVVASADDESDAAPSPAVRPKALVVAMPDGELAFGDDLFEFYGDDLDALVFGESV